MHLFVWDERSFVFVAAAHYNEWYDLCMYVCSSEQLLREKIEAVGELASIKSVMEEEKAKASFNIKELEVSLSTLELENQVCLYGARDLASSL